MKSKRVIRELRVVFDTNALHTQVPSDLVNAQARELIQANSSYPDQKISWNMPHVVVLERHYPMRQKADSRLRAFEMRALLLVLIWCISFSTFSATPEFAVGQVWAYKTRPGEEQSTLTIDKIEDDLKLGRIYHISVSGIQIKLGTGTFANDLPHLPVSLETLKLSCTTLLGQAVPNPKYLPGYRLWKEAHDAGHAGVYTISVAEIETVTERTLQKPDAHT